MTELTVLQRKLRENFPDFILKFNEPLSKHTSFRIGGSAEAMFFPAGEEQLAKMLRFCASEGIRPMILGAGTNVLAPDHGVEGVVVCLKDSLEGMELIGQNQLRVAAGVTMTRAAVFAANHGLSGLEFAHGIPGRVGGGVYMNAGAYGGEICQVCTQVRVMDLEGNVRRYSNEDMKFSYRHSILEDSPAIVLSADFALEERDPALIRERMKELQAKRSASQPLDLPSAGSAFKRPAQGYAAALIDGAGLKGYRVGDAAVSEKHAGFVVNLGAATAGDVRAVLRDVSDKVFAETGIRLEPEVRIW